ncbi:unnamed protein product [Acanthoscelides obtectus]|uniref:Methyltransferase type 11 domain-containing protein n=1 Tax=Acanthoscelides obtectus TaxID=200917 RepID=A0A9P0NWF2_ACAOB|nr:unnamed protein product [Acanthoscelides obtectus]CAK1673955.1 Probable tRNA methyltransferase 9B [Acanthoscelides obtectus]
MNGFRDALMEKVVDKDGDTATINRVVEMASEERWGRSVALEQAYVHDVYEQFADAEGPASNPWPKVETFLDDLEPGSIICDVGCGNGKYLNVNNTIFNIGGEKSNRFCRIVREKNIEVVAMDALQLPFRDDSLDAVVCVAVVHHLATTERRVRALRELARVLRVGGRVIVTVWAMERAADSGGSKKRRFRSQDVLVPCRGPPWDARDAPICCEEKRQHKKRGRSQSRSKKSRHNNNNNSTSAINQNIRYDSGSPSSSSLSSPNETCYSFVRRAIQKLAGGGGGSKGSRGGRPWHLLDSWTVCAKEASHRNRCDESGCECSECALESTQDIPIELRRIDDEEPPPQRRQTFPASQLAGDVAHLKSRSMQEIVTDDLDHRKGGGGTCGGLIQFQDVDSIFVREEGQVSIVGENPSAQIENINEAKNEPVIQKDIDETSETSECTEQKEKRVKPKLVKQKKSINEDDADEALDQPTDMFKVANLPDIKSALGRYNRGGVLKQRSLNEELMSTERLQEKERLRQNIQKQASLNEDLICHRSTAFKDTFKESVLYVSTTRKFQLIKTGFANKIKNSTTNINIEKVTGASLKNGFVKIFQNWKASEIISPSIPENTTLDCKSVVPQTDDKKDGNGGNGERRHSKEDGSDSSKDSSLQSDTSVDSEDSFASVIFVPKSDPMSPTPLSPGVPTSPRMPLAVYPLTKQLSSPKPSTESSQEVKDSLRRHQTFQSSTIVPASKNLSEKYAVQQIPKFRRTSLNTPSLKRSPPLTPKSPPNATACSTAPTSAPIPPKKPASPPSTEVSEEAVPPPPPLVVEPVSTTPSVPGGTGANFDATRAERLRKIREMLHQKPGFGTRSISGHSFPIVRQSSISNGKVEAIAKPLPKLLTLELFNPETDDKDSDSSCVSSPDSVESVISLNSDKRSPSRSKFEFPSTEQEARSTHVQERHPASLNTHKPLTRLNGRSRRRFQTDEFLSALGKEYLRNSGSDMTPLLSSAATGDWDADCQRHLTDFADRLSEKLLHEIDQYRVGTQIAGDEYDDPYISRLSEELSDLSKLSAEIQKQNEYLAALSVSDSLLVSGEDNGGEKFDGGKSSEGDSGVGIPSLRADDRGATTVGGSMSTNARNKGGGTSLSSESWDSDKATYSTTASTASLTSCGSDWKRPVPVQPPAALQRTVASSQETLEEGQQGQQAVGGRGGEITYHRYYHVFREGELDQLIEKYVENLHVISSYYDHASWCIVAEKVQVWTI